MKHGNWMQNTSSWNIRSNSDSRVMDWLQAWFRFLFQSRFRSIFSDSDPDSSCDRKLILIPINLEPVPVPTPIPESESPIFGVECQGKFWMSGVRHFLPSMSGVGWKILAMSGVGITPFMGPNTNTLKKLEYEYIFSKMKESVNLFFSRHKNPYESIWIRIHFIFCHRIRLQLPGERYGPQPIIVAMYTHQGITNQPHTVLAESKLTAGLKGRITFFL